MKLAQPKKNPFITMMLKIWTPVILLLIISSLLVYKFFVEPPPPKQISIATGSTTGAYFHFGEQYKDALAKDGIQLDVHKTAGSLENLSKLINEEVDMAFIQGGTSLTRDPNLRCLGSVYYEPIWFFYRSITPKDRLIHFRGKRINVGAKGSGTQAVARQLLDLNEIDVENSKISHLGFNDAANALIEGKIDAGFFVSSPKAETIKKLIAAPGVRLMNFRRLRSYTRILPYLRDINIPEGLLDMANNIPDSDIILLTTTATICVREDFHHGLTELFMKKLENIHGKHGMIQNDGDFPTKRMTEYPMHVTAADYIDSGPSFLSRYLPFWALVLLKRMWIMILPLATLMLPMIKIAPAAYRWSMFKRVYRWYEHLNAVEENVKNSEDPEMIKEAIGELGELSDEIKKISVPWSYRKDVYNLRMHLELVQDQMEERKRELERLQAAADTDADKA